MILIELVENSKKFDWVGLLSAVGTVGAVLITLFWEPFRNRRAAPLLEIRFGNEWPFVKDKNGESIFRLRIKNIGKSEAKNCTVKLMAVAANDFLRIITDKDPLPLKWSNAYSAEIVKTLSSQAHEYIDFISVQNNNEECFVILLQDPLNKRPYSFPSRDQFYFFIIAYSENCNSVPLYIKNLKNVNNQKLNLSYLTDAELKKFKSLLADF